jgi:hypothetical protein
MKLPGKILKKQKFLPPLNLFKKYFVILYYIILYYIILYYIILYYIILYYIMSIPANNTINF